MTDMVDRDTEIANEPARVLAAQMGSEMPVNGPLGDRWESDCLSVFRHPVSAPVGTRTRSERAVMLAVKIVHEGRYGRWRPFHSPRNDGRVAYGEDVLDIAAALLEEADKRDQEQSENSEPLPTEGPPKRFEVQRLNSGPKGERRARLVIVDTFYGTQEGKVIAKSASAYIGSAAMPVLEERARSAAEMLNRFTSETAST